MIEKPKSSELVDFVEKNYDLIKKLELISFTVFIIGFILFELNIVDYSSICLIIGIVATAISLFVQAFKAIEFEELESFNLLGSIAFINFIYKLYFFSLSISIMSLLGFVLEFKKGNTLAILGGSTLIIVLVLTFLSKIQNKSKVYDLKFYLRLLISLLFLGILFVEKGIIK